MATLYSDIYDSFYLKVNDFDMLEMHSDDRNDFLKGLMISAITRFQKVCKTDLSNRNAENNTFNVDLDEEEIDIISEVMVENWLKPKLNNSELLRNNLSTKDFSVFSPANLANSIRETYKLSHERSESLINKYSYSHNDVSEWKKQ